MDMTLKGIVAIGPAVLIPVSALHVQDLAGQVVLLLSSLTIVGTVLGLGVRISEANSHFVLSLTPFWRSRLRKASIAKIEVEEVRAFEDFGGWGIKGRSRGKGLLYMAGGSTVIAFTTIDGRRYLASVSAQDAPEILTAILTALSAGPSPG